MTKNTTIFRKNKQWRSSESIIWFLGIMGGTTIKHTKSLQSQVSDHVSI